MIDNNNDSPPKCFVVNKVTGMDITPASEFGAIRYLFDMPLNDEDILVPNFELQCIQALKDKEYNYQKDFIVLVGNVAANCRLIASLMSEHETVYTLTWDRGKSMYVETLVGIAIPNDIDTCTCPDDVLLAGHEPECPKYF